MVQGQDFLKEGESHKAFARGLIQTVLGHETLNFLNYQVLFQSDHVFSRAQMIVLRL